MKKFIAALVLGLSLIASVSLPASGAVAAPRTTSSVVETIDPGTSGVDAAAIAADWSKNTGLTVVVGTCTGQPECTLITVLDYGVSPCNVLIDNAIVNGCARDHQATQTCDVTINSVVAQDYLTLLYVAKHEVGHCLWALAPSVPWYGHLTNTRAIMYAQMVGFPQRLSDATLTSVDRQWSQWVMSADRSTSP